VARDGVRATPIPQKIAIERSPGLASCSHPTVFVKTTHPAKKAPLLHFPFRRLAICLDCDSCFELGPGSCPACGSGTIAPLARFFNQNAGSGTAKVRRHLLVVARDHPHIYEYLKRMFAGNDTLEVILDRRNGDRRRPATNHHPDRRRASDRRRQEIDSQLRALGWAVVMLDVARDHDRHRPRTSR